MFLKDFEDHEIIFVRLNNTRGPHVNRELIRFEKYFSFSLFGFITKSFNYTNFLDSCLSYFWEYVLRISEHAEAPSK